MYEQNRVSIIGRIIWFIVSVLVLAALVWLVLWLLFWRHPKVDNAVNKTKQTGSSVIQSGKSAIDDTIDSTNGSTASSGTGSTSATSQTSGSSASSSSKHNSQPTRYAQTLTPYKRCSQRSN
jgi:cytoskeletal protein RodZ